MFSFVRARRLAQTGLALIFLAAAGPVHAQDYAKTGRYAGLGFAIGFENFDAPSAFEFDRGYGFDARVGNRFDPHFGAELQLEYLNGFTVQGTSLGLNSVALTGNVRAYLCKGPLQPFALFGVGMLWQGVKNGGRSSTGFAGRVGGGIDAYLSESLALSISATYVPTPGDFGGLRGADYVSLIVGAQFPF